MTTKIEGQLEIDHERGVIYFHAADPEAALKYGSQTVLRISRLPVPVPEDRHLDVEFGHGVSWKSRKPKAPKAKELLSKIRNMWQEFLDSEPVGPREALLMTMLGIVDKELRPQGIAYTKQEMRQLASDMLDGS